ncbi:MAG: hypothetical protein ACOCT8_00930, partial [Actinomycetota bacterium]
MSRPRRGSIVALDDGRVRASLPVARGATKRRSATFTARRDAEAWIAAGSSALDAGEPLPDPGDYRRTRPQHTPQRTVSLRSVRQAARHWHEQTY